MQRDWNFCSQHFIQLDLSCAAARTQKNIPTQYWLIAEPSSSSSCYAFFLLLFAVPPCRYSFPSRNFFFVYLNFVQSHFCAFACRMPRTFFVISISSSIQQRKVMIKKRERMMHTLRSDAKNLESKKNVCTFESYWIAREASRKKSWKTMMIDDDDIFIASKGILWLFVGVRSSICWVSCTKNVRKSSSLHFFTTRVVWCRSHHGDTFHRRCVSSRARVSHRQTGGFYYAIGKVQKKTSGNETCAVHDEWNLNHRNKVSAVFFSYWARCNIICSSCNLSTD